MAKPLVKLGNKHLKAIELLVHSNLSMRDIAKEVGCTPETLSAWKNDDVFIKKWNEETEKFFNALTNKAIRTVDRLMNSENERIALDAAKTTLDKVMANKSEIELESEGGISINVDYGEKEVN